MIRNEELLLLKVASGRALWTTGRQPETHKSRLGLFLTGSHKELHAAPEPGSLAPIWRLQRPLVSLQEQATIAVTALINSVVVLSPVWSTGTDGQK